MRCFLAVGILLIPTLRAEGPALQKQPTHAETIQRIREMGRANLELQRASVARQRAAIEAVHPAISSEGMQFVAAAPPPVNCPPVSAAEVRSIIEREAASQHMDARLIQAIVEVESAYSPCAISPVGAMGLMQLMPATAASLDVTNPYDPGESIAAGTKYFRQMLGRYGGDLAKALAAYNAGPSRVDASHGIPPISETQAYVRKIMGKIGMPLPIPLLAPPYSGPGN
jgi:soluble lytic murein transglycosylase-like protein